MNCIETRTVSCPYCGEQFEVTIDCTAGDQSYVEDCWICCQPVLLDIHVAENLEVYSQRENG